MIDIRHYPLLLGMRPFHAQQIPREVIAGITLAALAIPEVMGYTKIAGTPVVTGLYTLLLPAICYAIFGSSRHLVVGADSATAAILASGLIGMASVGSDQYLALAMVLAIMVGVLVILASLIGLGFMADFLSRTVLVGFLTGVGIQVALGSLSGILGLEAKGPRTLTKLWSDITQMGDTNVYSLATAVSVVLVIVLAARISRHLPGAMLAVAGAIFVSWYFGLKNHLDVLGPVPGGLPRLVLPQFNLDFRVWIDLTPTAFAMVFVILSQSAATARAYANRFDEKLNESADLIGLGLANLAAGFSGTFVVNGSPTKTEMVVSAGGRTQLSLLVASLCTVLALLFLTQPLSYLPEAVLAGVVFLIGVRLIDYHGMRKIYAERPREFFLAALTALIVVVVGVEEGILVAVVLSLISHTRHGYRPKNLILTKGGSGHWKVKPIRKKTQILPGLMLYRFTHSMYYANAQQMHDEIDGLIATADPPLKWFCIDVSAVDDVDYTSTETLRKVKAEAEGHGVRVVIALGLEDPADHSRQELLQVFDPNDFYTRFKDVVDDYQRRHIQTKSHKAKTGKDKHAGGHKHKDHPK